MILIMSSGLGGDGWSNERGFCSASWEISAFWSLALTGNLRSGNLLAVLGSFQWKNAGPPIHFNVSCQLMLWQCQPWQVAKKPCSGPAQRNWSRVNFWRSPIQLYTVVANQLIGGSSQAVLNNPATSKYRDLICICELHPCTNQQWSPQHLT